MAVHLQDYIATWIVRARRIDTDCLEKDRTQARRSSGKKGMETSHTIISATAAAGEVLCRGYPISEAIRIQR